MKKLYAVFAILAGLTFTTSMFAQPASVTWGLNSSTLLTSVSVGNVGGLSEFVSAGPMVVFDYNSNGQRLWVGNTGWVAGPENPSRYIQFDATPTSGNNFTST